MMKVSLSILVPVACAVALFGCGAKEQGAEHPHGHEHGKDTHEHGKEHGEGKHGHADLQGAVKDLHDVLAPVYHMEKGSPRNDAACAKVAAFKEKSAAVATEGKPHADDLSKTAADLEAACGGDKATVEAKFEVFHDAFHKVMDGSK
jgi:ABC-type Zn2+ transport system substrate-binding protein/surface adhesin